MTSSVKKPSRDMTRAETEEWKSRLFLVSAAPTRFVGLLGDSGDGSRQLVPGDTFILEYALMFMSMIGQRPGPGNTGVQLFPSLLGLVPFELVAPATVEIINPTYVLRASEQPEALRELLFKEYLDILDPPKVVVPRVS